ncbi:MAG: hypothetical protein EXS03_06690 [Phycisphaerales bacterium]|nr:hypothetical protein [Phycisphaerales bacterium]
MTGTACALSISLSISLVASLAWGQVDLSEVFAPPSEAERAAVRAEWAARFPTGANWQVVAQGMDSAGRTVQVVRHNIQPSGIHYVAVRYPTSFDPQSTYPVVLCLHGGNDGVSPAIFTSYDSMAGTGSDPCSGRDAILVAPSYRCEPVITGQQGSFVSTGDCTIEDYEVDDVIGTVSGVLANIPAADEEHVLGWGMSHGGGVLLGVLARDHRVRAGVNFYGPADVFQSSSQTEAEGLAAAGGCDLPGSGSWRRSICDYLDGSLSLENTRRDLLRHSRGHFVDQVTRLDVHHGTVDPTVDVVQSRLLAEHAAAASPPLATFHYFEYPTGVHSIASLTGYQPRFRAFMCAAFSMPATRPGDINEDGSTDSLDMTVLLTAWGTITATHRADLDGNHTVDATDLAILLGGWGM